VAFTAKQKTLLFEAYQASRRTVPDVNLNAQYLFELLLRPKVEQEAEMSKWVDGLEAPHTEALAVFDATAAESKAALQQKVADLGALKLSTKV